MSMPLTTGDIARRRRPAMTSSTRESDELTRSKRPAPVMLFKARPARTHHQARVSHGHPLMSNTDTRVSVIVGVCQQDPERWREFDSIYRPMLFAFLRKQGLQRVRGQ